MRKGKQNEQSSTNSYRLISCCRATTFSKNLGNLDDVDDWRLFGLENLDGP